MQAANCNSRDLAHAELLFAIEECIAIMVFDGGLSLAEAGHAGVADTLTRWLGAID